MDISKMTDEELAEKLYRIYEPDFPLWEDLSDDYHKIWIEIAQFIRQCVKDSTPEGLSEIKYLIKASEEVLPFLLQRSLMTYADGLKIERFKAAIHAAQERKGRTEGYEGRKNNSEVKHPIEISNVRMISISEILPQPFKDVLVYGFCKKLDPYNYGFYIARRWTGSYQSRPYIADDYEWLTPMDYFVDKVESWIPIPIFMLSSKRNLENNHVA